jgi:hypothetical protein
LQELAGVLGKKAAPDKQPAAKKDSAASPARPAAAKSPAAKMPAAKGAGDGRTAAPNGHGPLPSGFKPGSRIKYFDGAHWVPGVIQSLEPAVLELDDESIIRTTTDVLAAGVAEGLLKLPE